MGVSQTAALNRRRHLYSAGRPSRWALAQISSSSRNSEPVETGEDLSSTRRPRLGEVSRLIASADEELRDAMRPRLSVVAGRRRHCIAETSLNNCSVSRRAKHYCLVRVCFRKSLFVWAKLDAGPTSQYSVCPN